MSVPPPRRPAPFRSRQQPAAQPPDPFAQLLPLLVKFKKPLLAAAGLVLLLLGGMLTMGTHADHGVRYVPVTRKVVSGRVVVKPRDGVEYPLEITPEMHNAQLTGSFEAYGGATNTVEAVVMRSSDYAEWIKGNDSSAYYSSGQTSVGQFALRLDPGKYSVAISNRVSKSAQKFVYLDVELIYYQRETY